jgi:hypothetical protein
VAPAPIIPELLLLGVGENPVKAGTLFTQLINLATQLWSMRVPAFTRLNETAENELGGCGTVEC